MQGISDRSCFDGWLHDRGDIQPGADQMVFLECGWRRLGEKSWHEQQHGIRRVRISTPRQTAGGVRGPIHEQTVVKTSEGSISGPQ